MIFGFICLILAIIVFVVAERHELRKFKHQADSFAENYKRELLKPELSAKMAAHARKEGFNIYWLDITDTELHVLAINSTIDDKETKQRLTRLIDKYIPQPVPTQIKQQRYTYRFLPMPLAENQFRTFVFEKRIFGIEDMFRKGPVIILGLKLFV